MKYCPICDERYDEEIIRFCTKDGTPLVDDETPDFSALPSEASEETVDLGEETIISRKPAATQPIDEDLSGRIVIPTTHVNEPQQVRPRTTQAYYPPPPPPQNTAKTVVLTILGTLAVVGFGAALFWFMQRGDNGNLNVNVNANFLNQNANINTNLGFDSNFNFNVNANFNGSGGLDSNLNSNIDLRSPTPSPSTSPTPRNSPTPSPSPETSPSPERSPTPRPSPVSTPSRTPANLPASPTPRQGPRPPALNTNRPAGNDN